MWPYVPTECVCLRKNCVDAHVELELCWSYVFLHAVTYFMWVFFYCKDPKTLIRQRRCTCRHMLIYNFTGQMFLGHHFVFHLNFFFFFFFFFCKSPFDLRLSVAKTQIKLYGCSLYWAIKYLWYLIPLEKINKQSNLEWKIDKVSGLAWHRKYIKWIGGISGLSAVFGVFQRTNPFLRKHFHAMYIISSIKLLF